MLPFLPILPQTHPQQKTLDRHPRLHAPYSGTCRPIPNHTLQHLVYVTCKLPPHISYIWFPTVHASHSQPVRNTTPDPSLLTLHAYPKAEYRAGRRAASSLHDPGAPFCGGRLGSGMYQTHTASCGVRGSRFSHAALTWRRAR